MLKLLVLADDFTGALDTGVQFSKQGIRTLVTTNKDLVYSDLASDVEILVIDTESRYLSFEESYQLISTIIQKAKEQGISYFYKKVDSALRGNISSEIKALVDQFPTEKVAMVPAFPSIDRVVRDGKLYINGQLVSESVFAQDPYEPVTESDIAKRLKDEAEVSAYLIQDVEEAAFGETGLYLFDSESEEDLEEIAAFLSEKEALHASIGCAGFAKHLVQAIFPKKLAPSPEVCYPIVVVCGSVNPITRRQIETASQLGHVRISLSAEELLEPDFWKKEEHQERLEGYIAAVAENKVTMFETLSDKTSQEMEIYRQQHQLEKSDVRFRIGQSLGQLTQQLFEKGVKRTFLFTGGDTLYQSMQVLGIDKVEPIGELSSGVVLAELTWKDQVIQVITKSGGFGEPELFENIRQKVKGE